MRENELARYGQEFKDRAVARMLPPESASPEVVSREIGVGVSTLEKWRSQSLGKPAQDKIWTAAARLQAVNLCWLLPCYEVRYELVRESAVTFPAEQ